MKLIRVGAACLNQTPLDWEQNTKNILDAIAEAEKQGIELLCLPELCVTGYGCEDEFPSTVVRDGVDRTLTAICAATRHSTVTVSVGFPVMFQNSLYNGAGLIAKGLLIGVAAKQHLAGDGIHYEPRWFRPWPPGVAREVFLTGRKIPFGDIIFNFAGVLVGYEICEDAWVADRPGATLAQHGVDIILNPSASHFAFGKRQVRERFVIEGSRAFNVTYVYANLLGNESGRAIYDGDVLIATGGKLVAKGKRFSRRQFVITSSLIDVDATRVAQLRSASFKPNFSVGGGIVNIRDPFREESTPEPVEEFEEYDDEGSNVICGEPSEPFRLKDFEFTYAATLALCDYLRKSHSLGFALSLSGGKDSAACATLVRDMVRIGVEELGLEAFFNHLFPQGNGAVPKDEREMMGRILLCAYQASENSSTETFEAAKCLAEAFGAEFHNLDVSPIIAMYTAMVSKALGKDLTWANADLALQNIQARVRAPSIWFFANLKKFLLITTSNRSEASVGYCTMDGDTAGSICPIGGIDKVFVSTWLRWASSRYYAALALINIQEPTAELRPLSAHQTDEADLMPYDVLDAAEKAAIRDKKSPLDTYRTLRVSFREHSKEDLLLWVTRYFTLWCRNQWKRDRYAPSFHFDDDNLDPKTWCRFPLLSGGFVVELRALEEYVRTEK